MADLPVTIDHDYVDSTLDPSVKLHQQHHDAIHQAVNAANNYGSTVKLVAGTPTDASFTSAPPDGTLAIDSNSKILYARVAGSWTALPPTTTQGPQAPAGYTTLAFYDDFTDSTLDSTKWNTYYAERGASQQREDWSNGQRQYYLDSNVSLGGGYCHLTSRRQNYTSPNTGHTYDWTSGMIESKYNFRYGWLEARIAIPCIGPGLWPAFWTWSNTNQDVSGGGLGGELDLFEFYSDNHVYNYITIQGGSDVIVQNANWTAGWHTYAVDWTSSRTKFYIDGSLVLDGASNAGYSGNLLVLVTAQIADDGTLTGVNRAPAPTGATTSPQDSMLVDYVAVWKP